MASRLFWAAYVLAVSIFLGRSGELPSTFVGWLWFVLFAVWLISAAGVVARAPWARRLSLLCFAPLAAVLLFASAGRVLFILRNGGMDCATCQGSPLVFLWHWQIELSLLAPGLVLAVWFWWSTRPRVAI